MLNVVSEYAIKKKEVMFLYHTVFSYVSLEESLIVRDMSILKIVIC
jgi:hypothetical protein